MDIKKLLPQTGNDHVYLDNAASTPPLPELLEVLPQFSAFGFVNPSATTARSHALKRTVAKLSDQFKRVAGLTAAELLWTAGGTESNNLAILGSAPAGGSWLGREIVTSTVEHPSVEQPLRILEGQGAVVRRVPVDSNGAMDLKAFEAALSPATHMVSICLVQ